MADYKFRSVRRRSVRVFILSSLAETGDPTSNGLLRSLRLEMRCHADLARSAAWCGAPWRVGARTLASPELPGAVPDLT